MFGEEEFKQALKAYEKETTAKRSEDFTSLKKNNTFFADITSSDAFKEQVLCFIQLSSKMNRDEYGHRYVLQTFLSEFCKYLDKDFLFTITEGKAFFETKEKLKEFTGKIYESHKKFTQSVALYSLEHLIEDYGTLLRYIEQQGETRTEETGSAFGSFWG
ncbi:MAG: hypothetical protein V3T58_08010 [Candidatus Hydrothermarchaeales archaeon]